MKKLLIKYNQDIIKIIGDRDIRLKNIEISINNLNYNQDISVLFEESNNFKDITNLFSFLFIDENLTINIPREINFNILFGNKNNTKSLIHIFFKNRLLCILKNTLQEFKQNLEYSFDFEDDEIIEEPDSPSSEIAVVEDSEKLIQEFNNKINQFLDVDNFIDNDDDCNYNQNENDDGFEIDFDFDLDLFEFVEKGENFMFDNKQNNIHDEELNKQKSKDEILDTNLNTKLMVKKIK